MWDNKEYKKGCEMKKTKKYKNTNREFWLESNRQVYNVYIIVYKH